MQTFGFCRIYDSKLGNSPEAGRRLDFWLNIVLYVGPYVAALGLIGVAEGFNGFFFGNAGPAESWREVVEPGAPLLATFIVVGGSLFSLYYLYAYWRLSRDGYRVSPQKVVLLVSTGAVSIYVWTFRPAVEAFFVSNLFHALQYFALLWASDRGSIQRVFGLAGAGGPGWLALVPFVIVAGGAGVLYESSQQHLAIHWAAAAAMVMSVMHFWFDGFVWSVRKREVG
jgi:hypothetical protein